ncbi:MAG: hypothetical protein D3904_09785 [Candidatus Electrothrix sp. EH2]|nr:hypothetical protein [Candidatus Electrothrix sp. EH2]
MFDKTPVLKNYRTIANIFIIYVGKAASGGLLSLAHPAAHRSKEPQQQFAGIDFRSAEFLSCKP